MNHIRQIEVLLSIVITSVEMQINTLHVLGGHRMRSEILHHTKQLVQALLSSIESVEREFTNEIEGKAEEVLGHSATLVNALAEARKEMPEMQILKELCNVAKTGHSKFTTSLAKEEERVTAEVIAHFALMKKRVHVLLCNIEKI